MNTTLTHRTNGYDATTGSYVETEHYDNGSTITHISAPHPRFEWEDADDLITRELREAMKINENSVIVEGRGVWIRNCRVQNMPSRSGSVRLNKNQDDTFNMTITYRSRKIDPMTMTNRTAEDIIGYLTTALGV